MKSLAIMFRHAPLGTTSTREGLDFAMLSASFEQQVSIIFTNEAVLHLLAGQTPEQAGSKDYVSAFKALSLYDINTVLVCAESMLTLGLQPNDLSIAATVATPEVISQTLQAADEVLVFLILHHIQTSVMTDDALSTCLRYIHPTDSILLSSDAVNCLLQTQWQQRLANIALFVLQDDVVARGLSDRLMIMLANKAAGSFDIIDYSQFVEQSLLHDKVITW